MNGKTVAENVPSGAKFTDTVYTHPVNHPASIITQTEEARFVTDAEKSTWNAKSNLALGDTSSTAYRGDRGKAAYDHSQAAHAPSNAQKNSDITKAEIEAKLTGAITSHTHSYLSDSPQDGKIYGRKDSSWTEVGSGSGADVYDWMWLYDIEPPYVTVTQQQYDELLAAVQTGKIFPQVANIYAYYDEEMEGYIIELGVITVFGYQLYTTSWVILPDLDVIVNYGGTYDHQVVATLPASPMPGVFYFVKE